MRVFCGFLLLSLIAAGAGAGMTATALHGWFWTLRPPGFLPPVWVFPLVSTAVFLLAGVAGWDLWRVPDVAGREQRALTCWGWMMGAAALLPAMFFGLHCLWGAMVLGGFALAAAAGSWFRFLRLNRRAALMLLPFIGWTAFTSWVVAGFWWCNH
jgi:tryptophan-rich sensory protein